jgi:hypothetical protein
MRQGGRRVLLWALGAYVLAQIPLVFWFVERCNPIMMATWAHKYGRLQQLTASEPNRPLLVMIGSSRTAMAFDAGRLNGPDPLAGPGGRPYLAYNCGIPTIAALQEWLCLREMLEAGVRPRLLVVELLPALMNEPRRGVSSEELWAAAGWLSLRQLVRLWPYCERPERKGRDWLIARLAPCYFFRSNLQSALLYRLFPDVTAPPQMFPHDPWGRQDPNCLTVANCWESVGKAHEMYHDSLRRFRFGRGACRAMRDLVTCCRQEGIPVVVVLMPESSGFRAWYPPEARAAARRFLAELHDECGAEALDANEWVADKDFIDGHHVRPEGARVFTTRLAAELRGILARGGADGRVAAVGPD